MLTFHTLYALVVISLAASSDLHRSTFGPTKLITNVSSTLTELMHKADPVFPSRRPRNAYKYAMEASDKYIIFSDFKRFDEWSRAPIISIMYKAWKDTTNESNNGELLNRHMYEYYYRYWKEAPLAFRAYAPNGGTFELTWEEWLEALRIISAFARHYDHLLFQFEVARLADNLMDDEPAVQGELQEWNWEENNVTLPVATS